MGISLNKKERDQVLNRYSDSTDVEVLIGSKMYDLRQEQAATRIQSWWRKSKMHQWFRIIF